MLRSKATVALMRLKEMDRKYSIKCNESRRGQSKVSTESSPENTPRNCRTDSKRFNNRKSKNKQIVEATQAQAELVFKSPKMSARFGKKRSKLKSIDSLLKNPKVSDAGDNRVVTDEEGEDLTTSKESSKLPSNTEFGSVGGVDLKKLVSEDSLRVNDESAVTILSKLSGGSEIVSDLIKSLEESSPSKRDKRSIINEQSTVRDNADVEDDETIEEVIRISDERSEIISELSHMASKSIPTNHSQSKYSSIEAQKIQYESNTFEDVSSSVGSSSSTEERMKKTSEEVVAQSIVRSGVKQIMITPHKQIETVVEKTMPDNRDKEIVELVAPKIIQSTSDCDTELDEELSNYVRKMDGVDEVLPINLLKSSRQTTSAKKHVRRNKKHRKSSNENTEVACDKRENFAPFVRERLTKPEENKSDGNSSMTMKSQKHNDEKKQSNKNENSSGVEQVFNGEAQEEKSKTESSKGEPESNSSAKLLREIPKKSDVTCTLRKLNRDAMDAVYRRYRIHRPKEALNKSKQCRACGTIVKLPSAEYEDTEGTDGNEHKSSIENLKESTQHQRTKRRCKVKRGSKSSKARRTLNREKVEEKQSRFDCKQMHRLRKQAVTVRLQQEREDIRNYLLELERTRLEFGPGKTTITSKVIPFKPLEFPKIKIFMKPDPEETNVIPDGIAGLQEKILTIRQWLKDQYILYRDYSSLAQTVNSKYIPANLEDAKRAIRELQKATINTR